MRCERMFSMRLYSSFFLSDVRRGHGPARTAIDDVIDDRKIMRSIPSTLVWISLLSLPIIQQESFCFRSIMKRILVILVFFLLLQQAQSFVLRLAGRIAQREQYVATLRRAKPIEHDTSDHSPVVEDESTCTVSRRLALHDLVVMPLLFFVPTMTTSPPHALAAAKQSIKPDMAFAGILKAREELITAAQTYLPKRDFEGLRMFFIDNASNLKNFEANSQALLASNILDAESKRAIGTIRTYGVGADVMIMYGGLQAELNENPPNSAQVSKYLMRTLDSLSEVISICRSNGIGGGIAYSEKTNACIDSVCT